MEINNKITKNNIVDTQQNATDDEYSEEIATSITLSSSVTEYEHIPESFYQFSKYSEYLQTSLQKKLFHQANIELPYFRTLGGVASNLTTISGKECINFASFNYLNLCGHPEVNEAAIKAIYEFGTSVCASRIVSGEITLHRELEKQIAGLLGAEEALVLVSGHATNVTTIGHLFGPGDLIIYDALCHNSIVQGALLSGAKRMHFSHNDPTSLEHILSRHRLKYERVLVVTEGLFSMDGDIAPMKELIEIKNKYKAFLMVDEAHSIGVIGKNGLGVKEYFNLNVNDVDIWMGTLSKTLAGCGGYIAGSHELIEQLRYHAPGFIFATGLSPALAAANLAALKIMQREPERIAKLQENSQLFLKLCRDNNLNTGNCMGYGIVPVLIGNSIPVIKLANLLYERGIQAQPIIYPAVRKSLARVRFFLNSAHTHEQIQYAVATLTSEIKKVL